MKTDNTTSSQILIDLSTLDFFDSEFRSNLRFESGASHYETGLLNKKYTQLFEFLCNVISFDKLVFDELALHSCAGARDLLVTLRESGIEHFSSRVYFPLHEYKTAIEEVSRLATLLQEKMPKKLKKAEGGYLENLLGYEQTRWVDDATLKDVYDRRYFLERPDFNVGALPRNFADTGMSIERLFVYLQVARNAGIPVSLAQGKYDALREVGARIGRAASAIVKKQIEQLPDGTRPGISEIEHLLAKTAFPKQTLPVPLLPGHIIRVAKERKCSIWDAVMQIRNDSPAQGFRDYLWRSRKAFDPLYAGEHLKLKQLSDDLERNPS